MFLFYILNFNEAALIDIERSMLKKAA